LGHQGIGCLLNAVMWEHVAVVHLQYETCQYSGPKSFANIFIS